MSLLAVHGHCVHFTEKTEFFLENVQFRALRNTESVTVTKIVLLERTPHVLSNGVQSRWVVLGSRMIFLCNLPCLQGCTLSQRYATGRSQGAFLWQLSYSAKSARNYCKRHRRRQGQRSHRYENIVPALHHVPIWYWYSDRIKMYCKTPLVILIQTWQCLLLFLNKISSVLYIFNFSHFLVEFYHIPVLDPRTHSSSVECQPWSRHISSLFLQNCDEKPDAQLPSAVHAFKCTPFHSACSW